MTLVEIVVALALVGVVLYVIQLLPIDGTIRQIIRLLILVVSVLWLLRQFGVISGGPQMRLM